MTETMLEKAESTLTRAARKLFEKRYSGEIGGFTQEVLYGGRLTYDQVRDGILLGLFIDSALDDLHADVRTVLRAIREPDEAMRMAIGGIDLWTACGEYNSTFRLAHCPEENLSEIDEVWQAGIDAILQEKPE